MKNKSQSIYLWLASLGLALSALACGSFRAGLVTPTPEGEPGPAQEGQPGARDGQQSPEQNPAAAADAGATQAVVAWLGKISSLPEGSQFDDFVALSPLGTGEFGLIGATDALEAEIRSLRDAVGPQEQIHFWGSLACEGQDYNGCQLVVERMQYGANYSEEAVSSWEGTIKASTFNSGNSFVFELSGDFPIWYSIYASQDPSLQAEIARLRDTGALVQVSGKLLVGIPDVNGTRIEVTSLEVLAEGDQQQPELAEGIDPTDGWSVFVNERYQYQIKYPPTATLEFFGPVGASTDEIPAGMDFESYLAELTKIYTDKLCVGIRYSLGIIYISAPPNQGPAYTPCGPTGIGSGEIIEGTEMVKIGGETYQARTMEIILAGAGDRSGKLSYHSQFNSLLLDDNTRIFFGSLPQADASYEDYLMKTRETLLLILSTYQKN